MRTKKKVTKKATERNKPHASATAAAILGHVPTRTRDHSAPKKRIKAEWQKYYNHLLELREQLMHQMNGLAKESAEEIPGYSLHMADSGTDNFDRDFALSLLSSDQDAVYEIEEALKRIERNTYGVCELTGKTIPKARLEAIPWTRFTVQAQAQLEERLRELEQRLGSAQSWEYKPKPQVDAKAPLIFIEASGAKMATLLISSGVNSLFSTLIISFLPSCWRGF